MTSRPLPGKRATKSRRIKLEDVAAASGVSISTASRALAGEKGVKPEIREKVLAAAKQVNYTLPVALAGRKIVLAASSAAMIDYVRNQFTLYVLEGLRERAEALNLEIVTRPIADKADETQMLEEAREDPETAGLLFLTVDDEAMLAATRDFPKPVVLLNGHDPLMRLSSVTPCNRSAARLATEHLIQLGHKRILFLMRPGRRTILHRCDGWQDALKAHHLIADPDLIISVDDWLPELAARAIEERIRDRGLDFSAIVTAGDSLAVGAIMGVQKAGFTVPDDVSVVGMDDLPQASFVNPPLTTMHLPMREIGSAALDLISDSMAGRINPARRVELACHLVERSSTAPAKVHL
ncbi:LacI family DNA-binding transcriptional regulator [Rhizobium rhizoryzae]|jgi:DNA-binding LacI/PurR family transcriptional regulator|uniref:LacI family DNA-binding transcriptional regulator n=1 Tax=Rhizobium rhizoryzae TaxID=451876 RepID=UPI0028A12DFE|nr:LacI family DNA-binding transcriptional regulator [Rhizobium rhizoryzae]